MITAAVAARAELIVTGGSQAPTVYRLPSGHRHRHRPEGSTASRQDSRLDPRAALVVVWLRQGGEALQQHLHELVLLLMTSLNKYRPGRSFPRNFGVRGAQAPRRAYQ